MPFIPYTPESLVQRSDSKNPVTTCRGVTNHGRPCRRPISKSPAASPASSSRRVSSSDGMYCWQHRDQAVANIEASPTSMQSSDIRERNSVDTLVDRLGILDLGSATKERKPRRKPVPSLEAEKLQVESSVQKLQRPRPQPLKKKLSILNLLLCCFGLPEEPRRTSTPANHEGHISPRISTRQRSKIPHGLQQKENLLRPTIKRDPSSRTGDLLSYIPASASPKTTALLLTELAKPVSDSDEEGFIYMFWLTRESLSSVPPLETAASLLKTPELKDRRTSDVLSSFAATPTNNAEKKILLKIGRARNVHRRLNQWQKQCGHNVSLIRYYPYISMTPSQTNINTTPRTPMKVPNVHKVERLIHLELNANKVQDGVKCKACGSLHKEWFEVEASRAGVQAVDKIVRRWVDWAERNAAG